MNPGDFRHWLSDPDRKTLVMGVINVTPDSFSDGGRYLDVESALAAAGRMIEQGAAILDLGAESTRPGALPVEADLQLARLEPVLAAMKSRGMIGRVTLSIDTTRSAVARRCIELGATMINDVSAGRDDPEMFPLAADTGAAIALMHMRGTPLTMNDLAVYGDVVAEVESSLLERASVAQAAGIERGRIVIDPGIGFAKTADHNLALLRALPRLAGHGYPVLLGTSRKRFLGTLTGKTDPAARVAATMASVAWGVIHGARIVRVHDVDEAADTVKVIEALLAGR